MPCIRYHVQARKIATGLILAKSTYSPQISTQQSYSRNAKPEHNPSRGPALERHLTTRFKYKPDSNEVDDHAL